jgi:effector-binding domain-containing protein
VTKATPEKTAAQETILGAVQLRHVPAFQAAMLTTRSAYGDLAGPFRRLKTWAEQVGVLPTGNAVGIFYGQPPSTPADVCRLSLCLPISGPDAETARAAIAAGALRVFESDDAPEAPVLTEGDVVEVREFPRLLAVVAFYRGPVAGSGTAYEHVAAWVRERPYLPSGAPREVYLAEPGQLGAEVMEVEVHQPVVPRGR